MTIRISGNGRKENALRVLLRENGYVVREEDTDVWVLPLPFSAAERKEIEALREHARLVVGKADEWLLTVAAEKNLTVHPILEDEGYVRENSRLSAEGAVYAAMRDTEGALLGAKCLIIGNGHLGTALKTLLTGMGASPTVAARRQKGQEDLPFTRLPEVLPEAEYIFNTVPFPVLTKELLTHVSPETHLYELASAPYGIDKAAAEAMRLCYHMESAIPGRYCPKAAAQAIFNYLKRSVLSHE